MPTSRPLHLLTDSDAARAALEDAATRRPEAAGRPTALLALLIGEGHRVIAAEADQERATRLAAIAAAGDGLEGIYGRDYLERLRDDWPA